MVISKNPDISGVSSDIYQIAINPTLVLGLNNRRSIVCPIREFKSSKKILWTQYFKNMPFRRNIRISHNRVLPMVHIILVSFLFLSIIFFGPDIKKVVARDRSFYARDLELAKKAATKGDYTKARALFEKIALQAPHNSFVNYALGRILLLYPRDSPDKKERLLKQREITRAIQLLSKSVLQDPASGRNLFYLGFAYYFGGYRDLAFSTFQRAVKIDPKYYQAYFNMGVIKEEQNEVFASQKYFNLYLEKLKGEKSQTEFEDF